MSVSPALTAHFLLRSPHWPRSTSKRVHFPCQPAPLPQIAVTDGPRDEPGRSSLRQPADRRRANPPSTLALTNDSGQFSPHVTAAVAFIIIVVIVALILPGPAD